MDAPYDFPARSTSALFESPAALEIPPLAATHARRFDRFAYAMTVLSVGLLALGTFWRLFNLEYPTGFAFDEHHFVQNARNYMARQADWNDHPALGKLLLTPAMFLFGDNGLGWRLSSALLGLVLVALAGLIASRIFDDPRVGLLATAFVAIDGFFISYSRIALLDTPLTVFTYGALALMLSGRSLWWFAAAAVCIGLAVATKWTGICVVLVAPWLLFRQKRALWHVIWMLGLAALIYVGVSVLALYITRQPISLGGLLGTNVTLLKHHAGFTNWDNAASSKWYSWPLLVHPILMHYEAVGATSVRATTSLGNVLLWFGTTLAIAWTVFVAVRNLSRALWSRRPLTALPRDGLFVVATMTALMLPFIVTRRQSYIFHYLGAYGLGLGLLASRLLMIARRFPRLGFAFLVSAAAISIFYVPVWTNTLVSKRAFLLRLPFPGWH